MLARDLNHALFSRLSHALSRVRPQYIPDGLTKAQWQELKKKEKAAKKKTESKSAESAESTNGVDGTEDIVTFVVRHCLGDNHLIRDGDPSTIQ